MSPICNTKVPPKNIEKDPNKLWIADNSADRGPFHDIGISRKRIRTAKNSVTVRPLKVNWAVCISLINNVSKVITNNQYSFQGVNTDHLFKTSHIVSGQWYRIYTVQKPTQRK